MLTTAFGIGLFCGIYADDLHAVIFNADNRYYPVFSLKTECQIQEHRYYIPNTNNTSLSNVNKDVPVGRPLDVSFLENMERTKLLYIGQYADDTLLRNLFDDPKSGACITNFLAKGGTLFFDYNSAYHILNSFLKSVGVDQPGARKPGACSVAIWPDNAQMGLFHQPNQITAIKQQSYSWWEKWSDGQIAPLRNASDPGRQATMIIQERVLGKGRVIFNQNYEYFRSCGMFTENLLTYIYGVNLRNYREQKLKEEGGPGELIK